MKNLGHLLNFFLFIFFALGKAFGFYFKVFAVSIIFLVFFLSLTYFFYRKNKLFLSDIFILLSFFALGAAWVRPFAHRNQLMDNIVGADPCVRPLTIKIISIPQERGFKNTLTAQVSNVDGIPVNGLVKVMDYSRKLEYRNSYKVVGRLGKRGYNGNDFYVLWVKSGANPQALPLSQWDKLIKSADERLLTIFKNNLDELSYRFSVSVFLGHRELFG